MAANPSWDCTEHPLVGQVVVGNQVVGSCQHEGPTAPGHHCGHTPSHQPFPEEPFPASPSPPGLIHSYPCGLCSAPHHLCGTQRAAGEDLAE